MKKKRQLLYKYGDNTELAAMAQREFIQAALAISEARALLEELIRPEGKALASRYFNNEHSESCLSDLNSFIERWATRCHLAVSPVQKWWVYDVALRQLRNAVTPAYELDDGNTEQNNEADERYNDEEHTRWTTSVDIRPRLSGLPDFIKPAFDPCSETMEDFCDSAKEEAKGYASEICNKYIEAGYKLSRCPAQVDFARLVRYQMLGESYQHIAANEKKPTTEGTVKVAISRVRRIVALPRRPAGRPRNS